MDVIVGFIVNVEKSVVGPCVVGDIVVVISYGVTTKSLSNA